MIKKLINYFLISLLLYSCSISEEEKYNKSQDAFAIYFLKNANLKIYDILNADLTDLETADTPWLSDKDIDFYDWSTHCIYLKKDKSHFFPDTDAPELAPPKEWTDKPWIVTVKSKPCYIGYFLTLSSINIYPALEIGLIQTIKYPKDILTSEWPFWFFSSDPRNQDIIKESLIENGLYRGGIKVNFDTTISSIKVFNDDTTSIVYSLQIFNNDEEALYIFDPAKVPGEIYHHYNNGPVLKNLITSESFGSRYKKNNKSGRVEARLVHAVKKGGIHQSGNYTQRIPFYS